MATPDNEIVVDDPDAPASTSPAVVGDRSVNIWVYLLLLGLAGLLGYDNWRSGAGWAPEGPEPGYFPFYLSIMLGASAIYGLFDILLRQKGGGEAFVTRAQFVRVLLVLIPAILFVLVTQFLGIYIASFLLVAGFMRWIGHIALWKSVLTAAIFAAVIFFTFEVSFNVIMPKGPIERALGF